MFIWMGIEPLSIVFPLIFSCAADQDSKIVDVGVWNNGVWVWDINLVKDHLDAAESAQLCEMHQLLLQVTPSAEAEDNFIGGLATEDFGQKCVFGNFGEFGWSSCM